MKNTSKRRPFSVIQRGTLGLVLMFGLAPLAVGQSAKLTTVAALPKSIDNYVAVEGAAGEVRPETGKNTFLYTLRDFNGKMVEVRTADTQLELHQSLRVFGIVHLEGGHHLVLDERHRVKIDGILAPLIGREFSPEGESQPPAEAGQNTSDTAKESNKSGSAEKANGKGKKGSAKGGSDSGKEDADTPWWRANAAALVGGILLLVAAIAGLSLLLRRPRPASPDALVGSHTDLRGATKYEPIPDKPRSGESQARSSENDTVESWGSLMVSGADAPMLLVGKEVVIGRGSNCGIRLADEQKAVSEAHAKIGRDGNRVWFQDTSTNGSLVDGKKVHHATVDLQPGAVIEIGRYTLTLKSAEVGAIAGLGGSLGAKQPTRVVGEVRSPTAAFMGAELRYSDNAGRAHSFPLKPVTTIGRNDDRDVKFDEDTVSGKHCVIEARDGNFYVRDDGSRNGTKVNGEVLDEERQLHSGDKLRLGQVEIEFASV